MHNICMGIGFFNVKVEEDKYIFISTNIDNIKLLSNDLFDYFFDPCKLFKYFKCLEEDYIFSPTKKNYATLYNALSYFFDDDDSIEPVSYDKAGKTGEYFLSILLLEYFEFECIIPKLIHITDQKMPIYGIDTLFYSKKLDLLMFGESKFSKSLSEGIDYIEKSLKEYEGQFEDEYRFIKLNKGFDNSKNEELKKFAESSDIAINFKRFLDKTKIDTIGIPLFICHGVETSEEDIMKELKKISKRETIYGLKTKYIIISLPIVDKPLFLEEIKKLLISKGNEYGKMSE